MFNAWIGLEIVPYIGRGSKLFFKKVPTNGPKESPIHLSVPIQIITVSSLIIFINSSVIVCMASGDL